LQPTPVANPRPLPQPPKVEESEGLPYHRSAQQSVQNEGRSTESKSSSTSSSREENASWDSETPRVGLFIIYGDNCLYRVNQVELISSQVV